MTTIRCWYLDWHGPWGQDEWAEPWAEGTLIGTASPDTAFVARKDGTLKPYLFQNVRVGEKPKDHNWGKKEPTP